VDSEKKLAEIISWLNDNGLRKEALELVSILSSKDDLSARRKLLDKSRKIRKDILENKKI
jgi:ATP phosphoribosyltransferase regulatory subunit HisZ